jgi:hypothetical protein
LLHRTFNTICKLHEQHLYSNGSCNVIANTVNIGHGKFPNILRFSTQIAHRLLMRQWVGFRKLCFRVFTCNFLAQRPTGRVVSMRLSKKFFYNYYHLIYLRRMNFTLPHGAAPIVEGDERFPLTRSVKAKVHNIESIDIQFFEKFFVLYLSLLLVQSLPLFQIFNSCQVCGPLVLKTIQPSKETTK